MKDVPFYNEIPCTPVYNAPFRGEQDAEKARWDKYVRECWSLLTTLHLVSDYEGRTFLKEPVEFLHHVIASLPALSWSMTHSRRVAIDRGLEAERPGT